MIYLDNAANTKMSDRVIDEMLSVMKGDHANPSSVHIFGRNAAETVSNSLSRIADCLSCDKNELYFTSGATESNNWAVYSAAAQMKKQGKGHLVISAIEHESLLMPALALKNYGFEVTVVSPDKNGTVSVNSIADSLKADTGFVSVMTVNNEIGTIQPIKEIASLCDEQGILFHTDAVQAVGNLPISLSELAPDYATFCAHKLHGPIGIGALYVKKGADLSPFITGGGQQRGMRSGTPSAALAAGFAKAVEDAVSSLDDKNEKLMRFSKMLTDGIEKIGGSHLNGKGLRIPSIVNFSFDGVAGESLALSLDIKGAAVSSSSACSSGEKQSHVIKAIGGSADESIRISMSKYTEEAEINRFLVILNDTVKQMRTLIESS